MSPTTDPLGSLADRWAAFAREEAHGRSALYEEISLGIAADEELLERLARLPVRQQQPNLLLAVVRYLGGTGEGYPAFRQFVLANYPTVEAQMSARRTQTNEVGRCAPLYLTLRDLPGPLALLELGASAGLLLGLDRYGYRFGDRAMGDIGSPVQLDCDARSPIPTIEQPPSVVWRAGIDLAPLDVRRREDVGWLRACVWPDQVKRLEHLYAAVQHVQREPPPLIAGDALNSLEEAAAGAPPDALLVVFHAAFAPYLDPTKRRTLVRRLRALRGVWISLESAILGVSLNGHVDAAWRSGPDDYLLARDGRALALTGSHGEWIRWLGPER
jgi:hypothetical protein